MSNCKGTVSMVRQKVQRRQAQALACRKPLRPTADPKHGRQRLGLDRLNAGHKGAKKKGGRNRGEQEREQNQAAVGTSCCD